MKQHGNRIWAVLLAALLAASFLTGCGGIPAETEGNVGSAPRAEASPVSAKAEPEELPPDLPAIGVGRIMPEVVEQRDILICVDPGHGFEDGGSGDAETSFFPDGVLEKDITIVVATLLNEDLQKRGFKTAMTHDGITIPSTYNWDGNDRFNPNERVALMNDLAPDYIVSIHTNTAGNPYASGVQIYYDHVSGIKANDWNEPAAIAIAEVIDDRLETTAETDLRNPINADNASLAVIRDTRAAACLIELGFCTNEKDAANLIDPDWQTAAADAIAEGIERFFDSLESGDD